MSRTLAHACALGLLSSAFGLAACNADTNNASTSGGNSAGGSANGNSSNSGSSATTAGVDYDACFACGDQACSSEADDCDSTSGCRDLLDCIFGCGQNDGACSAGCIPAGQETAPEVVAASTYYTCAVLSCIDECTPDIDTSTSASGGSSNTNSNTTNTPSSSSSTSTTGQASSSAGGSGGTSSGELVSGINWLSFDGSWADPSEGVNGALGVSGSMYAFGDGCASVTYDESSRCVSGTLCDPGADFAYWGMAIGFDFYNTGDLGSPANTKYPWSAVAVGAQGVAWVVSGYAPGLQAWITNMDSSWGGECSADDCGIDGPPDGTTVVGLGSTDTIYFSNMVKDDWGGAGTAYAFDASNILALQFKLASVVSGPVSFDFCISELGIVL